MLISYNGEARWPDKITPYQNPTPPKTETAEQVILSPEEQKALLDKQSKAAFLKNSMFASAVAAALVAFGLTSDSESAVTLLATFALAGLAGYQVVWGVAPALHSPLMAVTNAISGTTALGGMLLLGAGSLESTGIVPDSPSHWMGAIATVLSFINIVGGFLVSGKMLDLFRRPEVSLRSCLNISE
jgi:NAD(P) transhydrogenase